MGKAEAAWFTRGEHNDGERFWTLKDDAPEWLRDAVYEAHDGSMPCDWVFEQCRDACEAWTAGDDEPHEHVDSQVDVYTKTLFQWAADFCLSSLYATAEEEADGMGASGDTVAKLTAIQYCAIGRIVSTMWQACELAAEETAEEGES